MFDKSAPSLGKSSRAQLNGQSVQICGAQLLKPRLKSARLTEIPISAGPSQAEPLRGLSTAVQLNLAVQKFLRLHGRDKGHP